MFGVIFLQRSIYFFFDSFFFPPVRHVQVENSCSQCSRIPPNPIPGDGANYRKRHISSTHITHHDVGEVNSITMDSIDEAETGVGDGPGRKVVIASGIRWSRAAAEREELQRVFRVIFSRRYSAVRSATNYHRLCRPRIDFRGVKKKNKKKK